MNILILTTSTNNTPNFLGSLANLGTHTVSAFAYDRKYHEAVAQAYQANPSVLEQIKMGQWNPGRERVAMDDEMLREAKIAKPDAIIFISAWRQLFCPLNETLGELNEIAPLVHFLSDGSDPPWWDELREFERRRCFSLTVNIDGGYHWPGGKAWSGDFTVTKALTLLTPVDILHFDRPHFIDYAERPYALVFAGNNGGHIRGALVERLRRCIGFYFKDRDNDMRSYPAYADFLRNSRVSVNAPFTGSGAARQVKGRVLETGFAGACLLEWRNDATRQWFTPRHEYWEYESIDECVDLGEWLLGHPKIASATASALTRRLHEEHNPVIFWKKVFEAVGK